MIPTANDSLTYTAQAEISNICRPLFQQLGLNYFHYFRPYKDGSAFALYNRVDWHDYFWQSGFKTQAPSVEGDLNVNKASICLWKNVVPDDILFKASSLFNFDHPLSIVFTHHDYFECFAFGTKQGNDRIINQYFNNVDRLLQFTHEFRDKAQHLLRQAELNRFLIPNAQQARALDLLGEVSKADIVIQGLSGEAFLTSKELKVAQNLMFGYTAKELADKLCRSPRTIESHIDSIKTKLACHKRSELIKLLMQQSTALFRYAVD